jgi:hypothetical protein
MSPAMLVIPNHCHTSDGLEDLRPEITLEGVVVCENVRQEYLCVDLPATASQTAQAQVANASTYDFLAHS